MNKEKRLIKNTLIYAIGNMGSKLLTFLLIPLYTEYLSSGEYGTFDLIVNTVTLLMPLVTFQLSEGIYRYILTENDNKKIEKYISNGILVVIGNVIVFTIVYYIFCVFVAFKNKLGIYIYFVSMCLYTLWSQIARGLKKNLQYAIAGMLVTLVTMILNILFIVKFSIGINGLIYSYSLGFLVGFIYLEITTKIISFIKIKNFSRKFRGRLMKYSVPLIPNAASWWIMNVSDRYAITYLMGEAFNGIYAIANKFPSIIVVVNSLFNLAWQESSIMEYSSEDRDEFYTNMFNNFMKLQFTSIIVLLSFTKIGFSILVKGDFYLGYRTAPILYLASIFSAFASFYGTGYLSAKDTKASLYTTMLGAGVNIILNFILIPMVGIYGAAIATLISNLLVWIIRLKHTKKYFNIKINIRVFLSLISIFIFFLGMFYIDNSIMNVIMMILSSFIFFVYNKKLVIKLISKKG